MNVQKIRAKLSQIRHFPEYPGVAIPDSKFCRSVIDNVYQTLNTKEYKYRKTLLQRIANEKSEHEIKDEDGYLIADMSQSAVIKNALKRAKEIVASKSWDEESEKAKKYFLVEHKLDLFEPENEAMLKLAASPEMLNPVAKYLGTFPVLSHVSIWYSPNKDKEPIGSQRYHIDAEANRQIKALLPIEDVTEDSGPLTILPANVSHDIVDKLLKDGTIHQRNFKLDDDVIYKMTPKENAKKIVGKPGDVAFLDTCRCYHYGSRAASKPRIMICVHYYSAFCKMLPLWGRKDKDLSIAKDIGIDEDILQALCGKSHLTYSKVRTRATKKAA